VKTFLKILSLTLSVFLLSGCLATLTSQPQEPQELVSEVQTQIQDDKPMADKPVADKPVADKPLVQEEKTKNKLPTFFQPKLQAVFREYEKFAFKPVKGLKVNVEYLDTEDLQKKCAQVTNSFATVGQTFLGCAQTSRHFKSNEETNVCTIWTMTPTTFNDKALVQVLGHELLHCIGASHE
jgi:hypothetical protein